MMKVYICPSCGWIRVVSRRKDVECYKCSEQMSCLSEQRKLEKDKAQTLRKNVRP